MLKNHKPSFELKENVIPSYYEARKLPVPLLPLVVAKLRKLIEHDLLEDVPPGSMLWEPYSSHQNGLFSPLLVMRDFAARGADQYRCYLNSTRLCTFSM